MTIPRMSFAGCLIATVCGLLPGYIGMAIGFAAATAACYGWMNEARA